MLSAIFPFFQKLWEGRTKEEKKLLKRTINANYLEDHALKEMETRGIVIKNKDSYIPFSAYFFQLIDENFKIKIEWIIIEKIFDFILDKASRFVKIFRKG